MRKTYRDGKHYRERAEECRVLAELFLEAVLRAKMLKVASDYERMAVAADQARDDFDAADLRTVR